MLDSLYLHSYAKQTAYANQWDNWAWICATTLEILRDVLVRTNLMSLSTSCLFLQFCFNSLRGAVYVRTVVGCLTNAIAPPPNVQKSCLRTETDRLVFYSALIKKFFGWGLLIFCDWRHKWSCFYAIVANVAWPRAQPLGQSISLKFSLETRLEFESFEPSINFLAFPVQKLWCKINKLINYLISLIFLLF